MTSERADSPARATGRSRATGRAAKSPSAGMPLDEGGSAADRMAELESRLARLERSVGLRERGRDLMARVAPPEAGQHFRNAGREHLLGVRSIVDFWIRRIELAEERAEGSRPDQDGGSNRIEID